MSEEAEAHEHCKHYNDWPMHAPCGERNGDPGDGLGVQGLCCECDAYHEHDENPSHCPCLTANPDTPNLWGEAGYCCGCGTSAGDE